MRGYYETMMGEYWDEKLEGADGEDPVYTRTKEESRFVQAKSKAKAKSKRSQSEQIMHDVEICEITTA